VLTIKDGASPYNNRIEPTAGGRHGARFREPRAGTPTGAALPRSPFGPSSRFIRALYGRGNLSTYASFI
jgi:hypothetical protein